MRRGLSQHLTTEPEGELQSQKGGVLSEQGRNRPHGHSRALGTGHRPARPICLWLGPHRTAGACQGQPAASGSGLVWLEFYPLVSEEGSKCDVTRRKRISREDKMGEAMPTATDRSPGLRGRVQTHSGQGLVFRGEGSAEGRGLALRGGPWCSGAGPRAQR